MKDTLKKHWPLVIIFLLGLIPLVWFRKGMVIAGGDNYTFLNPSYSYSQLKFSWLDKVDAGVPTTEKPKFFPFSAFWFFGGKIGFSVIELQKLWIVLHFMLPGIFIYFLIKKIYRTSEGSGNLAGLAGAVLYMFNFLVIVDAFNVVQRSVLTFLPLMFYFWIKGLEEDRFSLKYSSLFALTSLLFASSNINFPAVSSIYLILLACFFYYVFVNKKVKQSLLFAVISFFLLFLVNLWWETDFYFSVVSASQSVITAVREYDFLKSTPILESFRTMGFWAFKTVIKNKYLIPFADSYYQFPLILFTYLIPILAFSSLFFRTKNRYKHFFACLAILGVFLSKGANPPFGGYYQFLYDKFPPFSSFREPFSKFTLISVFSFSVLLGFFAEDCYLFLHKKKKNYLYFIPVGCVLVILISFYPVLGGKIIQDEKWYEDSRYSLYVKIPDYWIEAKKWFQNNDPLGRVMTFPKNVYGGTYNWQSGIAVAGPVAIPLLPNPIIFHPPRVPANEENRLSMIVYSLLSLGEKVNLFPYLDLLNIKWLLQQNDATTYNEAGVYDPIVMNKILANQKYLQVKANFGKLNIFSQQSEIVGSIEALRVYSVQGSSPSEQVYSPGGLVYVLGKLESFPDIFSFFQYNANQGYYFSEDQPENGDKVKDASSLVLINLKDRFESRGNTGEFVYKFDIPRDSTFKLLVNNYLLENISKDDLSKYYLRLNGGNLKIVSSLGGWQIAQLGDLKKGSSVLETNLPVEIIKKEFITSPFWLVEDKEIKNTINSPTLSFTKVNPSRYRVLIEKSDYPYILVLSESYNPGWEIYYKNKEINADHFIINGYANGWYVDSNAFPDGGGSYDLELFYRPQKFADAGMIISTVTIFILFSIILISFFSKKMVTIVKT